MSPRRRFVVLGAVVLASATAGAQPRLLPQDSARFESKLAAIERYGAAPARRTGQAVQITDTEVNAYLRFGGRSQIPPGVVEPTLSAAGNGRVSGTAIVDLDAVRTQKARGWGDPMGYLTGRLPIVVAGTLTTSNGVGRFQLETAQLAGVTLPKPLLQELVSYYSRTPDTPQGIDMDAPFRLPARIREIRIGRGSATVVQ